MRILDLTTLYIDGGEGGVNTYLKEKSRCLAHLGCSKGHIIVVPGRRNMKSAFGPSTMYTVKSPKLLSNPQHRVLTNFARLRAILREEKPDVVEVDCSYVLAHVARKALRSENVPIVGFYHVHLPMIYTRPQRSHLRRMLTQRTEPLAWRYAKLCARPCDRVVVTTRSMYSRLEGRGFPGLELVPLGVNLELFTPRTDGFKRSLPGVDPARPVVLYVGRLSPEKDLEVLFAAHEQLEKSLGAQLVIAGDGPLRKHTERFARSTQGVIFLGMCPYGEELAQLYSAADLLAVPGRNETFGLIVLEAFASGLPVVAVRQGGPEELLGPGVGELAEPGNAMDFASKIRTALEGRIAGSACRAHVERSYSWEKTFSRLLQVYKSIDTTRRAAEPPLVMA